MIDMNVVVANNILEEMRNRNMKKIDLANAIGVAEQDMNKMLNGMRLIRIAELDKIADCLNVQTGSLTRLPAEPFNRNIMEVFMDKVNSEEDKEALRTADELADMIIFHANVRENAKAMSETWEM